jgi:putative hemolysin
MNSQKLIDRKEIIKAANLEKLHLGFTADLFMKAFKLDKLNNFYESIQPREGVPFLKSALNDLNIQYELNDLDLKNIPATGAFIIVANHPFGLLDGILLIRILGEIRPDFKVMANFLLTKMDALKDFFISVDPFDTGKGMSFTGIKATLKHLQEGHPVGIFPAGEVATYQKGFKNFADKEWQMSAIKMIHKAKVPVIPMFFQGKNSTMFHLLGKIHPALRTAKIPSELFRKKDKNIKIRIGFPLSPDEISKFENSEKLGRYLRARVDALGAGLPKEKKFYKPNLRALRKPEKIVKALPLVLVEEEIEKLRKNNQVIHTKKNFEVFIAKSEEIPTIMHEIGRLREVTFRQVGEGSNRKIDLDEFDQYYHHLFVWDTEAKAFVGAYRLGKGSSIFPKYGKKGFYTSTLFHMEGKFETEILPKALEMGRSFIVKDYQQKPLPLFLLWQGILLFLIKNPQLQYIIGPVSISNSFSLLSKSFLISFIKQHFYDEELAKHVKAHKEFEANFKQTDGEILMENFSDSLTKLDKLISDIEPTHAKVPILLKKYIQQNAKIVSFNIDPKFNDALDGLMLLNLDHLPEGTIENLKKELNIG